MSQKLNRDQSTQLKDQTLGKVVSLAPKLTLRRGPQNELPSENTLEEMDGSPQVNQPPMVLRKSGRLILLFTRSPFKKTEAGTPVRARSAVFVSATSESLGMQGQRRVHGINRSYSPPKIASSRHREGLVDEHADRTLGCRQATVGGQPDPQKKMRRCQPILAKPMVALT